VSAETGHHRVGSPYVTRDHVPAMHAPVSSEWDATPEDTGEWAGEATSGATPPPGYVPLEMPELWEPDTVRTPATMPVPTPHPAATVAPPIEHAVVYPTLPRSFDELKRTGVLAGRVFADLPQLAVAAVREGGYDPADVARLFRVPRWKLQQWLDAGERRR